MGDKVAKVTIMVLKVDLDCEKCYKKIKKLLFKFPQIRDQVFNEKQNTVTIKVVCCCPEKIRDKLCSKGGGSIKGIEIKDPEKKPKEPENKHKEAEKKPKQVTFDEEKKIEKPKEAEKPKTLGAPEPVNFMPAQAVQGYPSMYPIATSNNGFLVGPCYHMHGGGAPQLGHFLQYDGYYGRPVYDSWGAGGYNYNHECYEESPACTIM